jgi:hypothetical protein
VDRLDQPTLIARTKSQSSIWVEAVRKSNDRFESWIPAIERLHLESARSDVVTPDIMHILELHYGTSKRAKHRVVKDRIGNYKYLLLEGDRDFPWDIEVRAKKVDDDWKTYQSATGHQDDLRDGWLINTLQCHQVFLAYRTQTDGVRVWLHKIGLTTERKTAGGCYAVDLVHVIWESGADTVSIGDVQPDLPPGNQRTTEFHARRTKQRRYPGRRKGG